MSKLPREAVIERFQARYTEGPPGECWIWQGAPTGKGYGVINIAGCRWLAHRLALELTVGPPPHEKSFACHTCDVRLCVNPAHLYWGDAQTNADDAVERGRLLKDACRRGHPRTPENVYERVTKEGYTERACIECRTMMRQIAQLKPQIERLQQAVRKLSAWQGTELQDLFDEELLQEKDMI